MIRFNISGEFLELPANFSLQFQKKNLLFAFDSIELERSTSFDIPATPTNDQIFKLAKWVQSPGTGMRRRYSAQMQAGMVTKEGYLYISSYDGGNYKAIFITGELLGLKAIREAGALNSFLQYDSALDWNLANIKDANAENIADFDLVRYLAADTNVAPSVSVRRATEDAIAALGLSIDWTGVNVDGLRVFNPNGLNIKDAVVHLANDATQTQDPIELASFLGLVQFVQAAMYSYRNCTTDHDESGYFWLSTDQVTAQFYMLSLPYTCVIEFPRDFPADYFLATEFQQWPYDQMRGYYYEPSRVPIKFLGEYGFGWGGNTYGSPLAGRKVTIPAGTPFMLISRDIVAYENPGAGSTANLIGLLASSLPVYDFSVKLTIEGDFAPGGLVPYNAILPSITLTEMLQAVAAISGTVLNFENDTLKFDALDFTSWDVLELTDVMKKSNLTRVFGDYARANVVGFSSGASVLAGDKLTAVYYVDNDNIAETKDLQTLKVSEGGTEFITVGDETPEFLKIRSADDKTATLARTSDTGVYMERITLPKNENLQTLCDASTCINIDTRASLLEFQRIEPKKALYYDGALYVWTEASWTKDTATLKLSKFNA